MPFLRGSKEEAVLQVVKAAGIVAIALVAPNAVQLFAKRKKQYLPGNKYYYNKVTKRLIEQGLLINKNGFISLSEKGETKLTEFEFKKLPERRWWDRKYRVIIFDIKEQNRLGRDRIRRQLVSWGLTRLQNSVWVYPFDCEDMVSLLKNKFFASKDLLYLVAEKIENDRWIREKYDLPLE